MNDMTNFEVGDLILELVDLVDSESKRIRLCSSYNDPDGEMFHRGKREAYSELLDFFCNLITE